MAGSLLGSVLHGVLSDVVLEVQLAGLPPFKVPLSSGSDASPLLKALRPRITVYADGDVVVSEAPYGEPSAGTPTALIAAGGAALGTVVLVALAVRGALV